MVAISETSRHIENMERRTSLAAKRKAENHPKRDVVQIDESGFSSLSEVAERPALLGGEQVNPQRETVIYTDPSDIEGKYFTHISSEKAIRKTKVTKQTKKSDPVKTAVEPIYVKVAREVLVGKSTSEIEEALGIGIKTVYTGIATARKKGLLPPVEKKDPSEKKFFGRLEVTGFVPKDKRVDNSDYSPLAGTDGKQILWSSITEAFEGALMSVFLRTGVFTREAAEDYVQEVFIRVVRKITSYDGKRKFSTWVLAIAENYKIDMLRAKRFEYNYDDRLLVNRQGKEPGPEAQSLQAEQVRAVRDALERLPAMYRNIIYMRYFEEKPCREIAVELGMLEGTVKTQLHRGKKYMGSILNDESISGIIPTKIREKIAV